MTKLASRISRFYASYKDAISVALLILAIISLGIHYQFVGYEERNGLPEDYIAPYPSLQIFVYYLSRNIAIFLLSICCFIAWPVRTNRITKLLFGVFSIIFILYVAFELYLNLLGAGALETSKASDLFNVLFIVFAVATVILVFVLGRVIFFKVDKTDTRYLLEILQKNKELEELIYRISHDAFLAEAARAKGWLELIKLKRNEITDPDLLEYLDGLEASFSNMRRKTNSLMNFNPEKYKEFVHSDQKKNK